MLTSDGMDLSVKRVGLYDEKTRQLLHRLPNVCCLFKEILESVDHGSDLSPYLDTTFSYKNNA